MLSKQENELMTRVGPGTPAGEMLRRYWWPVGFTEEVKAKGPPVRVRLLSEDFVLFRDGSGRLGFLGLHCSHRGASLEYGRVEDKGIRCCYHGWVYDVNGRCLEQPAEPEDSTFKDRIKHPAYKVQELGGLMFAYIGPEPAPLLPRYDLLLRNDGGMVVGATEEHCNWLQRAENGVDPAHIVSLHASGYPNRAFKRPAIEWERTWYGIAMTMHIPGISKPNIQHRIFPSHSRNATARIGDNSAQNIRFRVPTDDTKTTTFWRSLRPNVRPFTLKTLGLKKTTPGVYEHVDDGWWGIESREQDRMAQESQGVIADRTKEHLGTSDRGVIMLRQMIMESIEAVRQGRDPIGVIRDAEKNDVIQFNTSIEEVPPLE